MLPFGEAFEIALEYLMSWAQVSKAHLVVKSGGIKFLERIHIALQKNHVPKIEGVQIVFQVMF